MNRNLSITLFLTFLSLTIFAQKTTTLQYNSFHDFYTHISGGKALNFEMHKLADTTTMRRTIGIDTLEVVFSCRVDEWNIRYVSRIDTSVSAKYYPGSYILINDQKIIPDENNRFEGLSIMNAVKINFNSTKMLMFLCWYPKCNGTTCRKCFVQLFRFEESGIKYQIDAGWQIPPNIYCDLDNDGQLDMISFYGESPVSNCYETAVNTSDKSLYCIRALTLENDKWVEMTDKNKNPYFIQMQSESYTNFDSFKVLDFNWMFEL